jgi:hypothetical protein
MSDKAVDTIVRNAPALILAAGGVMALAYFLKRAGAGDLVPTYCDAAKGPRGISDEHAAAIASQVRDALYTGLFWEDEDAAIYALVQCRTDADVYAVACAFDKWAPLTQTDRDLFAAIAAFFDIDERQELNQALADRGISVTF